MRPITVLGCVFTFALVGCSSTEPGGSLGGEFDLQTYNGKALPVTTRNVGSISATGGPSFTCMDQNHRTAACLRWWNGGAVHAASLGLRRHAIQQDLRRHDARDVCAEWSSGD